MAIKMLEKQTIKGEVAEYGAVVQNIDEFEESVLIAHGKAVKIEEVKPAAYSRKKGDE